MIAAFGKLRLTMGNEIDLLRIFNQYEKRCFADERIIPPPAGILEAEPFFKLSCIPFPFRSEGFRILRRRIRRGAGQAKKVKEKKKSLLEISKNIVLYTAQMHIQGFPPKCASEKDDDEIWLYWYSMFYIVVIGNTAKRKLVSRGR